MEGKKVKLTNSLIKTTLWTHNTWIFTFAAGQGQAYTPLSWTMGNVRTKSWMDAEAVQKIIELIIKTLNSLEMLR